MDSLKKLGRLVTNHDTFVNIIKHVQNPCVQVTAEADSSEVRTPQFLKLKEAKEALSGYYEVVEDLTNNHASYMEKLWQLQGQCTDQNIFLDVTNQVYIPAVQVTVTSRHQEETAEGKTFQQLAASRHTPNPEKLPTSCLGSTRTLAALVYFILFRQVSGEPATVAECTRDFKCDATMLEQLTTGKTDGDKQSKGPKSKRKSSRLSKKAAKKAKRDDDNEEEDD